MEGIKFEIMNRSNVLILFLIFLPQFIYCQNPIIPERRLELWEYEPVFNPVRGPQGVFIINAYNLFFHPILSKNLKFDSNNIVERFFVNKLEFTKVNFLNLDLKQPDVSNRVFTQKYPAQYHDTIIGLKLIRTYSIILRKPIFIVDGRRIRKRNILQVFDGLQCEEIKSVSRVGKFIMITTIMSNKKNKITE